ncbi:MAG: hypothetical protein GXO90_09020 [FCB group bacterium]|nr:hypothetical protein [FCB group bacterium]
MEIFLNNRIFSTACPYILFTILSIGSGQKLKTVAVLAFEGRGVSSTEVASLTDRLITELGNTHALTLVERQQLDKILEEQGLQQSGCTSQECVAEVGQLLGVKYMISGSVNKLGDTYTIDAKMFSVETGENVITVSKTHRGEIDELIPLMEKIAWELVGLDKRKLSTVAVLDFEGRGITQMEAGTLTDRFTTELGNTGAVLLVARKEMNEVLQEQGFQQQSGCTTEECAAEIGAMLGVNNIVNGAIGKVGETYTIDAQMINVSTGATIKTVSKTYRGEVDGLITEIELLAWSLVEMDPPKTLLTKQRTGVDFTEKSKVKTQTGALVRSVIIPGWGQLYSNQKKWGYGWLALDASLGAVIIANYQQYNTALSDYNKYNRLYDQASEVDLVLQYKSQARTSHRKIEQAANRIVIAGSVVAGTWALNFLQMYLTKSGLGLSSRNTNQFQMAFNPLIGGSELRWNLAL